MLGASNCHLNLSVFYSKTTNPRKYLRLGYIETSLRLTSSGTQTEYRLHLSNKIYIYIL